MSIYNVKVSIVELVDSDSRTGAIGDLVERLEEAGFTVYEFDEPDAFESETQS